MCVRDRERKKERETYRQTDRQAGKEDKERDKDRQAHNIIPNAKLMNSGVTTVILLAFADCQIMYKP